MATDYNDGLWHGWNGGECPVHMRSEVEIIWRHGDNDFTSRSGIAGSIAFLGNDFGRVIAFRVVKEYREPRYVWLADYGSAGLGGPFKSEDEARTSCPNANRFARFCEVTDEARPLPNLEDA